jgi:peptide methionine sulfoxide reductase msrA/msrB
MISSKGLSPALFTLFGCILLACFIIAAAYAAGPATAPVGETKTDMPKHPTVYVRVFDEQGKLTEPVVVPKVLRTAAEWKQLLTDDQFAILRKQSTEPAFCGGLLNNKELGAYLCAACNLPLFSSDTKFESKTGWPSFFQPIAPENIRERADFTGHMERIELTCPRCDSHLGHVFEDGPRPTGLRFCLNSAALKFVAADKFASVGEKVPHTEVAEAVFAGGCFWCVEAVFEELDGVYDAISGYAGGEASTANYEAVCTGATGHAEAVKIIYDPKRISYEKLLKVHFATHDPTTLNRQGNDVGTQYRSTIFYANEQEKALAAAFIADLNSAKAFKNPIVTTLEPLKAFYVAESHHQNYVCRFPQQGYIANIAMPKVEKVREKFKDLLKADSAVNPK